MNKLTFWDIALLERGPLSRTGRIKGKILSASCRLTRTQYNIPPPDENMGRLLLAENNFPHGIYACRLYLGGYGRGIRIKWMAPF